jgi:hypothetical protein
MKSLMNHEMEYPSGLAETDGEDKKGRSTVVSNQRLTALAGVILLVLILIQLMSVTNLHTWIAVHIVVGILLTSFLLVKLGSTGYRFLQYYTHSPAYVRSGPPRLPLRLLAPVLIVMTLTVVGSGIGMVIIGPAHSSLFRTVHSASVVIWLSLLAVHVGAYLLQALQWVVDDWKRHPTEQAQGRWLRLGATFGAMLAGAVVAYFLYTDVAPWVAWYQAAQKIPGILIVGMLLAIVVLIAARPYRWR